MFQDRKFFSPGINMYVPIMTGSAEFLSMQPVPFYLGAPALGVNSNIFAAASINGQLPANTDVLQTLNWVSDCPYGRTVQILGSGDPGANGLTIDLFGWDYLNQPMVERLIIASTVVVAVLGKKAFMRVLKARVVVPSLNAVTARIGTAAKLGLPYKCILEYAKEDGALINRFEVGAGKFVYADITDPATSSTGDPRGTYECAQTLNGVRTVNVGIVGDYAVSTLGNGGLHGIRQAAA